MSISADIVDRYVMTRATKIQQSKIFCPFLKFIKHPQTKFCAHTVREYQVIRS